MTPPPFTAQGLTPLVAGEAEGAFSLFLTDITVDLIRHFFSGIQGTNSEPRVRDSVAVTRALSGFAFHFDCRDPVDLVKTRNFLL